MVAPVNNFSPSDLIQYIEMLIKDSVRATSNYRWLNSRHLQPEVVTYCKELEKLKPMILKMTPENCAKIAVKFESLTDVNSAPAILKTFKNLLQEQYSIQLLENKVKSAKERKNRSNKVQPEHKPERLTTVSFII